MVGLIHGDNTSLRFWCSAGLDQQSGIVTSASHWSQFKAASGRDPACPVDSAADTTPFPGLSSLCPFPAAEAQLTSVCLGKVLPGWAVLGMHHGQHRLQAWVLHVLTGRCVSSDTQCWGQCRGGTGGEKEREEEVLGRQMDLLCWHTLSEALRGKTNDSAIYKDFGSDKPVLSLQWS